MAINPMTGLEEDEIPYDQMTGLRIGGGVPPAIPVPTAEENAAGNSLLARATTGAGRFLVDSAAGGIGTAIRNPEPIGGTAWGGGDIAPGNQPLPGADAPIAAPATENLPPIEAPLTPAPITVGPVTTTERTRQSAQALAGQAQQQGAANEAINIAGRAGGEGIALAKDISEQTTADAAAKEKARVDANDARAAALARRDAAYAERDRILNDAEKTSLSDYWTDKSAGARALALVSGALGTYVAIAQGVPNYAQQEIDKAVDRDTAAKQAKLKQAIYRAGIKGTDAREAYENGILEINLRKSDLLDKLADERAATLAKHGIDQSKIAGDAIVNDARMKAGKLKEESGHLLDVKIHSSNQLQQELKLKQAEAQVGAGAGKAGDRAASHKIDLGIFGSGVVDAIKEANALKLSHKEMSEALSKVQENETTLKSQEGQKSAVGAFITNRARGIGAIPAARTTGLSPRQTQFINKMDIAQKKVATVLAGQGRANSHEMMEALRPQPGDDPESIRQKMLEMAALGQSAKDEAGQYGDVAAEAIRRTKEAGGPAVSAPPSSIDRAAAAAWINNNPDSPKIPAIRAKYGL